MLQPQPKYLAIRFRFGSASLQLISLNVDRRWLRHLQLNKLNSYLNKCQIVDDQLENTISVSFGDLHYAVKQKYDKLLGRKNTKFDVNYQQ